MQLVILSDSHGSHHEVNVPPGDVLIHCGDCTPNRSLETLEDFLIWYERLPHKNKILIAGNHDGQFERHGAMAKHMLATRAPSVTYLYDSGVVIDGIKFWGSPYTPEFFDWHFMYKRGAEAAAQWAQIPENTDVLITHGPPHGFLDLSRNIDPNTLERYKDHLGCEELRKAIDRLHPQVHCFGHIHGSGGMHTTSGRTMLINASLMDENYYLNKQPQIFNI